MAEVLKTNTPVPSYEVELGKAGLEFCRGASIWRWSMLQHAVVESRRAVIEAKPRKLTIVFPRFRKLPIKLVFVDGRELILVVTRKELEQLPRETRYYVQKPN